MVEKAIEEWGWSYEPPPTPEGEYWRSWNGHSPELEFCKFAAEVISLNKPMLVIETGTGQGYVTRRAVPVMPDGSKYICFETNEAFVERMNRDKFFLEGLPAVEVRLGDLSPNLAAEADLTILDSAGGPVRIKEINTWWNVAKPGAMVLIHDVSLTHPIVTTHYRHAEIVKHLKIPGVFMVNPRGSFFGQKHA